jgi:hypothetical protein
MSAIRTFRKESNLTPPMVLREAVRYFGPEGLGLQLTEETAAAASFVGGGGYITVETGTAVQEGRTSVEIRTADWCYHAERFLDQI